MSLGLGLGIRFSKKIINMYPLDAYGGNIKLGFSYYKLYSTYAGNCVRVRRSSDNAEQDFGFVGNYIDIVSILAFVGAGYGYVTTWYNQCVGGNNAVQVTSGKQPIIVSSGVFEFNGLKFISIDTRYLEFTSYADIDFTTPPVSIYINYVFNSGNTIFYKNNGVSIQFGVIATGTINFRINNEGTNVFTHTLVTGSAVKSLYNWQDKNENGLIGNQNSVVLTATQAIDITVRSIFTIGIRNIGGVYSASLTGNIKTLLMANNNIAYSVLSKV